VIDLHTHILPGLDDGAQTLGESIAMARAAVAEGIRLAAATPHVRGDYPTPAAEMERLVREVGDALTAEGIDLKVLPGGEIALDRLALLDGEELSRFGLGGNRSCLLLEFPYYGWPLELEARVFELRTKGFLVVLAHPERNSDVQAAPARLRRLVEHGAIVQLTSASVDGRLGAGSRRTAFELLDRGLAHLIASDAHSPETRELGLARAVEAVGRGALARWLTVDVPAAIIDGEPIPDRPPSRRKRSGRFFGRA
jgi:protein-tyrosine phosphatase